MNMLTTQSRNNNKNLSIIVKTHRKPTYLDRLTATNELLECVVEGCTKKRRSASKASGLHANNMNRNGHYLGTMKYKKSQFKYENQLLSECIDLNLGSDSMQLALGRIERLLKGANLGFFETIPQLRVFQACYDSPSCTPRKIVHETALWFVVEHFQPPHGFIKSLKHRDCLIGNAVFNLSGLSVSVYRRYASNRLEIANYLLAEFSPFYGALLQACIKRHEFRQGEAGVLGAELLSN
ncbi:hypothetical protein ACFLZU_03780 [Thermodesulfobacteriota bacterium]